MLGNYLKVAVKVLLRRKFYTFISLFGIAFTLLILMVVTALVDHVLAPGAPESNLGRILTIQNARLIGEQYSSSSSAGYALLHRHARDLPGVEAMSITSQPSRTVSYVGGEKIESHVRMTDSAYWDILDFEFVEGGPYTRDDTASGRLLAVINETTRERFFGDGPAVGGKIELGGRDFEVVGVTRNVPPTRLLAFAEAWIPIEASRSTAYREELLGAFHGILLAGSPADFPEIQAEFSRRVAEVQVPDRERFDRLESYAASTFETLARDIAGTDQYDGSGVGRFRLYVIIGVLLFMLLPAVNLVNLSLSRILERSSEIGVRKAFGASSRALVGQFLVESVVLALIGGLVGFGLTAIALRVLNSSELIPYGAFGVNLRVLAMGMLLSVAFGILAGVYPAWRMSRLHPVESIRGRAS